MSELECWNFREKGHFKHNCPNPKKINSPKKTGSVNAAAESESDGDGVWAVDTNSDWDGSMPSLDELSDSDNDEVDEVDGASVSDVSFFGEEDWFLEPEEVSGDIEIIWHLTA